MSTFSLAAAQTIPRRADVDANTASHVRLAQAAAERGARLLVFPELSLTGYELDLAESLAFSESDPRLAPLAETAAAWGLTLVVGAPVRLAARLYIGAFILYPDRSTGLYTKHTLGAFPADASPNGGLPPAEASVFAPGDRQPLVRTQGRTSAVAVCADTGRAAHPADAARRGASTYLASMFFTPHELRAETTRLQRYAKRHSMTVVLANFGGPSGGLPGGGGSAIWSEQGELLAQLAGTGAGLVIATKDEALWRAKAIALADD